MKGESSFFLFYSLFFITFYYTIYFMETIYKLNAQDLTSSFVASVQSVYLDRDIKKKYWYIFLQFIIFLFIVSCNKNIAEEVIIIQESESLHDIMGIKWETSTADVFEYFKNNNYDIMINEPEHIRVKTKYKDMDSEIGIHFYNNKAYTGDIFIRNSNALPHTIIGENFINDVLDIINIRYGKPYKNESSLLHSNPPIEFHAYFWQFNNNCNILLIGWCDRHYSPTDYFVNIFFKNESLSKQKKIINNFSPDYSNNLFWKDIFYLNIQ